MFTIHLYGMNKKRFAHKSNCVCKIPIIVKLLPEQALTAVEQVERGERLASTLDRLPNKENGTLLCLIESYQGQLPLIERLLQAGADPNFDDGHDVPISAACTKEVVKALLDYNADPEKCRRSPLNAILSYYGHNNFNGERGLSRDPNILNHTLETMELLLKNGAPIDVYRRGIPRSPHFLYSIVENPTINEEDKKILLSFFIHRGYNPNDPCVDSTEQFSSYSDLQKKSVYEILEENLEYEKWALFIRRERGWYRVRPLLIATCKKQPDDCYMSFLPVAIVEMICDQMGMHNKRKNAH